MLLNELSQLCDLADLLEGEHLVLLLAIDGETGGVVSSVLETRQACQQAWLARLAAGEKLLLTIEKGVEDKLAVLLDKVVDVTENATGSSS